MGLYDTPGLFYDSGALYDTVSPPPERKRMAKVKLALKDLTRDQLADKGDTIKTALTGNPNFTTPVPTPAAIGTAATTLRTKIAAINSTKAAAATAVADGDAAFKALADLIVQSGGYVQTTSGGDPVKIQSAGFDVASDGAPVHMTKVANLSAAVGDSPGEIDLNWNPVSGAKSYEIQTSTTPDTESSWAFKETSTKSKATLNGLTSASKIWVRVRAVGANDKGGFSDPAESVVP